MASSRRITVVPEGRDGVYLAEKDSLIRWLEEYPEEEIHCFLPGPGAVLVGADWPKHIVIQDIAYANRVGILSGKTRGENRGHALAVIVPDPRAGERLEMFDVGEITVDDHLDVVAAIDGNPQLPGQGGGPAAGSPNAVRPSPPAHPGERDG
jgi:hypothetical protein